MITTDMSTQDEQDAKKQCVTKQKQLCSIFSSHSGEAAAPAKKASKGGCERTKLIGEQEEAASLHQQTHTIFASRFHFFPNIPKYNHHRHRQHFSFSTRRALWVFFFSFFTFSLACHGYDRTFKHNATYTTTATTTVFFSGTTTTTIARPWLLTYMQGFMHNMKADASVSFD